MGRRPFLPRIAGGGYAMMPGKKSRKKRTAKPSAPAAAASPETTEAEEAPTEAVEMQAPQGYLPLPQAGFVPQAFQYSQVGMGGEVGKTWS